MKSQNMKGQNQKLFSNPCLYFFVIFSIFVISLCPVFTEEAHHSADYSPSDYEISLSELLRVIQLYNTPVYQCDPDSEDGYAVGNGGRGSGLTERPVPDRQRRGRRHRPAPDRGPDPEPGRCPPGCSPGHAGAFRERT